MSAQNRRAERSEKRANDYRNLLKEAGAALRDWAKDPPNGAFGDASDLIDWFELWGERVRSTLRDNGHGPHYEQRGLSVTPNAEASA